MSVLNKIVPIIFNGSKIAEIKQNKIYCILPCSNDCLLSKYNFKKVALIKLGSTRPDIPGLRIGSKLIVTNVFTSSNRRPFYIKRTFENYVRSMELLKKSNLAEIVKVFGVCKCMTEMEYLNDYKIFDNTSKFSPEQHDHNAWLSNKQSVDNFKMIVDKIIKLSEKIHSIGVIHTDITGFNIFIDARNNIKLLDLFSCIPIEAILPSFLPLSIKKMIGIYIENKQIQKYLINPAMKVLSR